MFFFFDLDLGEQLVNSSRVFFFLALVGVIDSSPLLCGGMVARFVCFPFYRIRGVRVGILEGG